MLMYDEAVSKQVKALGKSRRAAAPKYTTPVDLQSVWIWFIEREAVMDKQTLKQRYNERRDKALFLLRNDRVNRSDDEYKWDARQLQYCRCYGADGKLIDTLPLALAIEVVIKEDGVIEVQYLDPKDPRKRGQWSDVVTQRPVRLDALVAAKFERVKTEEEAGSLCAVRSLLKLVKDMDQLGILGTWNGIQYSATEHSVPAGHFWASKTAYVVGTRKARPLLPQSLASIVKKITEQCNVGVVGAGDARDGWGEAPGATEKTRLAGHYLRGHAGSIAFELATNHGASWEASEGIDRARHTLESFFKNYLRGVVPRLIVSFNGAPNKKELRFEEATRG